MNESFLCLSCGAACVDGEPACCANTERLEVDAQSPRGDRHAWWKRRMLRRTERELRAIESLLGDRVRAFRVLKANALKLGRMWRARRLSRQWPLWWEWTAWLSAAIIGNQIAAEMAASGSMHRWPPRSP